MILFKKMHLPQLIILLDVSSLEDIFSSDLRHELSFDFVVCTNLGVVHVLFFITFYL